MQGSQTKKEEPMTTTQEELGVRQILEELITHGDDLGWVEYTDGGVWVTDKGVAQINQLIVAELEKVRKQASKGVTTTYSLNNGYIARRIAELTSNSEG